MLRPSDRCSDVPALTLATRWSPFEVVHLYLQNAFVPLFNAFAKQLGPHSPVTVHQHDTARSEGASKNVGEDDRDEQKAVKAEPEWGNICK